MAISKPPTASGTGNSLSTGTRKAFNYRNIYKLLISLYLMGDLVGQSVVQFSLLEVAGVAGVHAGEKIVVGHGDIRF